jgi:hypothetical protein
MTVIEEIRNECIKCSISYSEYLLQPVACYADSNGSVEHEFRDVVCVQIEGF